MAEILKRGVVLAAATAARAGLAAGSIGLRAHREAAHKSVKLSHPIGKTLSVEQRFAGTNTPEWAADHRMHHHQFPDADLYNFWKTAHAIQHSLSLGMQVPERYKGYDKGVNEFSREDVLAIGAMADEYLQGVLKEHHWIPDFSDKTVKQMKELLEDESPKYQYDESFFDKDREFSDDEVNHILLRDQHSPALAPSNANGTWNGIRYVFKNNVKLSKVPTKMYRERPYLMPQDLRDPKNKENKPVKNNRKAVYAGFAVFSLVAVALSKDKSLKGILKAATAGSIANAGGMLSLKEGGDFVNSFGHMGPMTPELIRKAMFSENFEMEPNPDGTYASDTENGGFIGKLMSMFTLDESGKQRKHHLFPGEIAFDDPEEKGDWKKTPFGSFIEYLADNKYVPFIKRGPGLPRDMNGRRADEAHPAMDIIVANRIRTMEEKEKAKRDIIGV